MFWYNEIWFLSNVFQLTDKFIWYRMIVNPDQEYRIQYKDGGSHFSKRKADHLLLAPKLCHLWMEWILVLWTQLLDPTCKAKRLTYFTWYMKPSLVKVTYLNAVFKFVDADDTHSHFVHRQDWKKKVGVIAIKLFPLCNHYLGRYLQNFLCSSHHHLMIIIWSTYHHFIIILQST